MTRRCTALRGRLLTACLAAGAIASSLVVAQAQDVSLEYRLKAAYLFNFTKFVDWPATSPGSAPLVICVAAENPFGPVLGEIIRDERVNNRPLQARVVREPAGCHVLFIPEGVPPQAYLRAVRGQPVLTVGETTRFLRDGGIVNFVREDGKVRFEIDREAAVRANLTISSRLLRLARVAVSDLIPHDWRPWSSMSGQAP